MPPQRPYSQEYDQYANTPVQGQVDNPLTTEFLPVAALNRRVVPAGNGNAYALADQAVSLRGSKQIIWSSEAFTNAAGIAFPALTTNQKKATGTSALNLASPTFQSGTVPTGVTVPTTIDFSPFRAILLLINVSAITGTSMTFEIDFLDDSGTPNTYALKAAATTATGQIIMAIGTGVGGFPPGSAPTGYGVAAVAGSTLIYPVQIPLAPQGQIAWTASSITAFAWNGWLYGIS